MGGKILILIELTDLPHRQEINKMTSSGDSSLHHFHDFQLHLSQQYTIKVCFKEERGMCFKALFHVIGCSKLLSSSMKTSKIPLNYSSTWEHLFSFEIQIYRGNSCSCSTVWSLLIDHWFFLIRLTVRVPCFI